MEVGSCGVLDMSRVYPNTLFGPMFYSWWNCPLTYIIETIKLSDKTMKNHKYIRGMREYIHTYIHTYT